MAYNSSRKLKDNLQAIEIALNYHHGMPLTSGDIDNLRKYSGFGGIKAILYPNDTLESWVELGVSKEDLKMHGDIISLHRLLETRCSQADYKAIILSMKNSVLTAFYTPEVVPRMLFEALKDSSLVPRKVYEPSAGAGVFIHEAVSAFPHLELITGVEKDKMTGLILSAINSTIDIKHETHICGLEDTPARENGSYDLVVSNIPFGNFSVDDPEYPGKELSGKIHNYFFAKGIDKLADGGILAYITTDAFLNGPSNKEAREYLFQKSDFIGVAAMPDNLMSDTGNTQAPSHLLLVQKNDSKIALSPEEILLTSTDQQENVFGAFHKNTYLQQHPEVIIGSNIGAATNQYGQAHERIWQEGDINLIGERLKELLMADLDRNLNRDLFSNQILPPHVQGGAMLTYLPMPADKESDLSVQLGIFDMLPAENISRGQSYLSPFDLTVVRKETARIVTTIRTADNPVHESVVLLTAKTIKGNHYSYKMYSNVKELDLFSARWTDSRQLSEKLRSLSEELKQFGNTFIYEGDSTLERFFSFEKSLPIDFPELKSYYSEGTLVIHNGQAGTISGVDIEFKRTEFHPLGNQGNKPFYENYCILRDRYMHLSGKEVEGEDVSETERNELNAYYDNFVNRFGQLNGQANRRLVLEDQAFGMTMLSSLERREDERFVKADVLTGSLKQGKERFETEDPMEALAHSLNDLGRVDMEFIQAAMGIDEHEAISRLGDRIYLDPTSGNWETADQYLSGNVVAKLEQAKMKAEGFPENQHYRRSLEAIQEIQPERVPFGLLDFNLGERWIPEEYYRRFATDLFDKETSVNYFPSLDTFKVTTGHNTKIDREYAIQPKNGRTTYGYTILEYALENTVPFFTYEVSDGNGKTVRVPDNEAIQLAHQKIEQIRSRFISWLGDLPVEDRQRIESLYNNTFNCYVLREFDGSHLKFPGLNKAALGIEDLYSSQKNAAWRIIQNKGALVDHEVGLGKTLTMIVAAHEMKRLKIVHKPAILALKANVDQITSTYRKAYPEARILAPKENDFTPEKRLRLFHEIRNNNWDCIILTHDQFGKIPQSPEIQEKIFNAELENIERDLVTAKELGGDLSKKILKGLEIRKNNLAGKLKSVIRDIENKKDRGLDFSNMGIDHLFVDESHKFKNLTFTTRHSRVAGLGNVEGSQKALNMLFAIRTLQERFDADLCATFLSGTPISNSLTEMYLIFKYLRPREMLRQRIENFDGWAAVFARKTTDFEFSVTNEIIAKERFRHFIKVPELALFYNEITDYKTARHISLDKPEIEETLVNISPNEEQAMFIKKLMEFAKTGNGEVIGRAKLSSREDKARMLIATNYAKKMSADMRLISPRYADFPESKVNTCARRVAEIYKESAKHRGTQIVFSDIGTPKQNEFNIYDALKQKLVGDHGIPAGEITFIHDWTERTKPELFRKMNQGTIRVLLGSTDKAGTGLNVQERVVAMHHIDIPWKPSEFEQRNGRGARQGNRVAKEYYGNKVRNFIYATERSLDNYKFNLLKNKQLFIAQMKNCELNIRTIDEGAIDENSGMNYSEYIAILSGDTSLLEKSRLEKKVAVLESLKSTHFREISRSRYALEHLQRESNATRNTLQNLAADETYYIERLRFDKDGIRENPIQFIGLKSKDSEIVGQHIISLYKDWRPPEDVTEQKIGNLYGFSLYIRRHREAYEEDSIAEYRFTNSFYAQRTPEGIRYNYNAGRPNIDNPKLAARHFLNAIDKVGSLREKYARELAGLEEELPKLAILIEKPFAQENELQEKKDELGRLERQIAVDIQEKKLKEHQEGYDCNEEQESVTQNTTAVAAGSISADNGDGGKESLPQNDRWQQKAYAQMRKNTRMKF